MVMAGRSQAEIVRHSKPCRAPLFSLLMLLHFDDRPKPGPTAKSLLQR